MRFKIHITVRVVLFSVILLMARNTPILGQEKQEKELSEITAFLKDSQELRNYADKGFTTQFTGELCPIPEELQRELSQSFPEFNFYIPKMIVLVDAPPKKYDLILIADAINGSIKGFLWGNYWTLPPSKSFQSLLKGHQALSNADAINRIRSFAKLIALVSNDKVGETRIQNGRLSVELVKGAGVFSVLEVRIDKRLRFDRLTITQPNGEKLRYLVG